MKSVVSSVHRFIEWWNKISAEIRLKPEERNKLDKLFDIRPKNLCTDDSLRNYLRKHSTSCWSEEFDFFIGQLRHPQFSTIFNIQDKRKAENDKKAERAAMSLIYFLNNSFNSEETSSSQGSKRRSANDMISSQDSVPLLTKRSHKQDMCKSTDSDIVADNESDGIVADEWQPSAWQKYKEKSNDIVLKLPGKKIPTLLASVSTTTKTSIHQELKIIATLLNAGGADINKASQSVSTVYRQ